jgi:SAM-dependent methyltransferase
VEIDLLRTGPHVLAVAEWMARAQGPYHYLVCVNRAEKAREDYDLYPRTLPERLPKIGVPLAGKDSDAVLDVQAVLEHVADPYRCCEEIHRVLKAQGVVYAETPFMQQVHGGRYDFTRFTLLGHRRLFRKFEEIDSGAVSGPGTALAWAYQYFLLSFTASSTGRRAVRLFSRLTAFYLKYFDYYLINKSAALDAASGFYFIGTKSEHVLSDKDLIKLYRGANL